ncbi:MAG: helix-turn-helix domain-containing protein, partial [Gemmatimonadales bacterium]|nr:helix-turn-helix domain-containing protein [Gemmatimonadales bacterium]
MADYLSAVQAAELIGCSDTFVRNQIKTGSLKARKVRGTWRIRREDAISFEFDLDEHEAPIAQNEFAKPDERSGALVQNESNGANEQNEAFAQNESNGQIEPDLPTDVARPRPGPGSRVSAG